MVPLAIGAAVAFVLWTLRRVVPDGASTWLRPPAWLLPFWLISIAFALAMGGIPWVSLI